MRSTKEIIHILPIHIINPHDTKQESLYKGEEFESLIHTFGGVIVDRVMQKIETPDNATYIRRGKVSEIVELVKEKKIDIVILNAIAKPRQIHSLQKMLQQSNLTIEVWDRIDLILQIFDKHAITTEAKLQIELARMRYMGPRIYGMGYILSRQGGGIGTLGIGETNTELMKRHWRNEMKRVTEQLEKISKWKEDKMKKRERTGLKTVSLVGYTNAGKSTLFNRLPGKHTLVANALFATLDSTVGTVYIPLLHSKVLITDTIGFIRDLPPHLISAFKSTLIESIHADILLHVIDISDPEVDQKITLVNKILEELGINLQKVVYVFNKIDLASDGNIALLKEKYKLHTPLFISGKDDSVSEQIKNVIKEHFTI